MKVWGIGIIALVTFSGMSFAEVGPDEWKGFSHEDAGITASEFDLVKEHGMTKAELLQILEYGVMPSEYFSEPWKKLGVSQREWMNAKKQGMEDGDIDRTVYNRTLFNWDPVISFVLPGFYAYKTQRPKIGGTMTGIFVVGAFLTVFHQEETKSSSTDKQRNIYWFYPIVCLTSMVWSAGDAYISTRFRENADATRFSFDLTPKGAPSITFISHF